MRLAEDGASMRCADLPDECDYEMPWPIDLNAFVDVTSLDFRFKDGFRVHPEFRPIPFEKIGLVESDFRQKSPDKSVYRREVFERFKEDRSRSYDPEVVNRRYPLPSYLERQAPNSIHRLR